MEERAFTGQAADTRAGNAMARAPAAAAAAPPVPPIEARASSAADGSASDSGASRRDATADEGAAAKTLQGTMRSRAVPGPASAAEPFALLTPALEAQLRPERWITYLIELRQRGEHDAADASLLRFRARHPEHAIPAGAASRSPG